MLSLIASVEQLRAEVAAQPKPVHTEVAALHDELRSVRAEIAALSGLAAVPLQISELEQATNLAINSIDTLRTTHYDSVYNDNPDTITVADIADRLDTTNSSIERLNNAMVDLYYKASANANTVDAARDDSISDDVARLNLSIEHNTNTVELLRAELVDLAKRQAREIHALRKQLTQMHTNIESRRDHPAETTISSELDSIRQEMVRLRPEGADVVTASQLAETINTLRGAGVEDISAAHLVHTFQLEMRTLRNELSELRRASERV